MYHRIEHLGNREFSALWLGGDNVVTATLDDKTYVIQIYGRCTNCKRISVKPRDVCSRCCGRVEKTK